MEKHGLSGSKFYTMYQQIKARCDRATHLAYPYYGGKGIKYEWVTFEDFKKDMYDNFLLHIKKYGEKNTTIDRIDNEGNYNKKNCRFATIHEQQKNQKHSKNVQQRPISGQEIIDAIKKIDPQKTYTLMAAYQEKLFPWIRSFSAYRNEIVFDMIVGKKILKAKIGLGKGRMLYYKLRGKNLIAFLQ